MPWVFTRECLRRMLIRAVGSDTTTTAPFSGAIIGLLKDQYAPTVNSLYAGDVQTHEANYDGYVKQGNLTFSAPSIGQGQFELSQDSLTRWQPTGSTTINTIYGHFLLASDSVTLLGVEMFGAPIPLSGASYSFVDVPILGLDPSGNYGRSAVSN